MALISLNKMRLTTKRSSVKPQPSQDPEDETETTYDTQEDIAKDGCDKYDDVDQDSRLRSDTGSSHPVKHRYSNQIQQMPRRSSLKGSNPGSRPRSTRRHSLTFADNVSVRTITPIKSLADKDSLWFEAKDYNEMHQKNRLIVKLAKRGEGSNLCTRGLEIYLGDCSKTRQYAAWDAVLFEQAYQAYTDHYDDGPVSNSYRKACEQDCFDAILRGLKDQYAVKEYLSDTRKDCRRMPM